MSAEAFWALNVAEHLLDCSISLLISFSDDIVQPIGSIHLLFTIGTGPCTSTITTNFLVVDCPTLDAQPSMTSRPWYPHIGC
ncbi:hypothetical protein ACFXTI_037898 [Malus domestica]